MSWLPSVLIAAVGVLLLAVLVLWVLGPVRRLNVASRTLTVATTGRTMRVRAAFAQLRGWRARRRSAEDA